MLSTPWSFPHALFSQHRPSKRQTRKCTEQLQKTQRGSRIGNFSANRKKYSSVEVHISEITSFDITILDDK